MCMSGGCGKSGSSSHGGRGSYSPKKASFPKAMKGMGSASPKYVTRGGSGNFGQPKVKVSFGRRGY